jgi:hypothetical protein
VPGDAYPTTARARAADEIVASSAADPCTDAVLRTGSCERARDPDALLVGRESRAAATPAVAEPPASGRFTDLDLDVGELRPGPIVEEGSTGGSTSRWPSGSARRSSASG